MVAPQLDTEHPGIRVIAEVASVLQAGLTSGVALRGVVAALRRGLNRRRCRLWLRTPDGTRYAPVTTPGDEAELPGYAPPVSEWVRQGPHREGAAGGSVLRLPLIHEDEPLGALEVIIPSGRYEGVAHDVVVDRKSTRLNSSHGYISYAVFCLKKKKNRAHLVRRTHNIAGTDEQQRADGSP